MLVSRREFILSNVVTFLVSVSSLCVFVTRKKVFINSKKAVGHSDKLPNRPTAAPVYMTYLQKQDFVHINMQGSTCRRNVIFVYRMTRYCIIVDARIEYATSLQ